MAMKKLSAWMATENVLRPLFDVVDKELKENLEKIGHDNYNYSKQDQADLRVHLTSLRQTIVELAKSSVDKDSVKGEHAIESVYVPKVRGVDIITLLKSGCFKFVECKFALKPGGSRPFYDPKDFIRRVAEKFDTDLNLATADGEDVGQLRIIVVTDEHFDVSLNAIRMMMQCGYKDGECSTDGKKHNYALVTCSSLRKLIDARFAPKPKEGEIAYFCL